MSITVSFDEFQPPPTTMTSSRGDWRDWIGIVASIGCAIHCAAMPFVIAFLPALGLSFLADEAFHRWMAVACIVIALAAFIPGLRRHRRWIPAVTAAAGLSLITVTAFGLEGDCCAACQSPEASNATVLTSIDECCEHCAANVVAGQAGSDEANAGMPTALFTLPTVFVGLAPWITPLGGFLLVGAHLLNRRYGCLCGCCETPV